MAIFHPENTSIAEWQSIIAEAKLRTHYTFDDNIESYLILTLDQYTKKEKLLTSVIALNFLKSINIEKPHDGDQLRNVGDQCLILSGLFPECAIKKNVSLNYFIGIGQRAYLALTNIRLKENFDPVLYKKLSYNFVGLMDLLHAMRS